MLQNKNVRLFLWVLGVLILGYVLWNVRTIIYYFFDFGMCQEALMPCDALGVILSGVIAHLILRGTNSHDVRVGR